MMVLLPPPNNAEVPLPPNPANPPQMADITYAMTYVNQLQLTISELQSNIQFKHCIKFAIKQEVDMMSMQQMKKFVQLKSTRHHLWLAFQWP
jgi:hypothetical protein